MIFRIPIAAALLMTLAAGFLFNFLETRVSGPLLALSVHPQIVTQLETSLADQRELARRDPGNEALYRERFAELETLVQRLHVLEHNREQVAARYELIVLTVFGAAAFLLVGTFVWRHTRQAARLDRVGRALAELAVGRTDIELGERRRDVLGKIARMIEQTSRRMARDQKRLAALRHLSAWQEAARRHAHEMRTPLTGARLELERLLGLLESETLDHGDEIRQAAHGAGQELERLGTFAQQFTSFARLPRPERKTWDLALLLDEYTTTFGQAWSNLELSLELPDGDESLAVAVDRDMLRQVLVNLCDNSSLALGDRKGRVVVSAATTSDGVAVRVRDNGPGVAEEVRPCLFEPYVTTRKIGHGMGLGLAICKKILLDHGGDLELADTSDRGTIFRMTLPAQAQEEKKQEDDS